MMKGLSPGAALVFLMAGPATNVATISVLSKSLGKGAMLAYLMTITGGALLAGALIDTFLPEQWFTGFMNHAGHNHNAGSWLHTTASIVLALLIVNGIILKWSANKIEKNRELNTNNMAFKTFLVEGMTCKNCKAHVEKSIKTITGVDDVIADVANGQVRVSGNEISNLKVKQMVEESGYLFKGEANN